MTLYLMPALVAELREVLDGYCQLKSEQRDEVLRLITSLAGDVDEGEPGEPEDE